MNVRAKMISVLALLFAVLIVLDIGIQKHVLLPSFAELERDDAKTSMRRIENVLNMALDSLQLNGTDWGDWADAYQFVQGRNPDFAASSFSASALNHLQVNTVLMVDLQGNVVAGCSRDLDSGAPLDIDISSMKALPADFPWRRNLKEGRPARGLVKTSRGIMLLAGAPILDGSAHGPWAGMVIMGKLLTAAQVGQIGAQAQANVTMLADDQGRSADHRPRSADDGRRSAHDRPGNADELIEGDAATTVSRRFIDIYGNPLMTLRVEVSRKITERGQIAVSYAATYLMIAALAALTLLVIVLNRVVLSPLAHLTRHAVALGEGNDLTARLNFTGHDEVAVLAGEFDRMVERVAESRRQLMDQSFQAGFAELAKGVLHNLGNAMTPLGVRLTKLGERLRDAPAGDIETAAAELAGEHRAASERHRDLQEFLRLGSRELAVALREAQADVMVIQRQTTIVQTALSELMRSTRNEHVVESVRLPDLVSQTLEIVPDTCRQRLMVEADDSLQRVGVVHVARTVLRLILQNLIINAADAVREAGRDKGVLRVAAEIVRDSEREQLHLRCEDDGIGISHADLERVFDKGFSTKSRDTNYGIGLHWCANAVAGLGGRIWASSDGPGRGASMHLLLPLTGHPATLTS